MIGFKPLDLDHPLVGKVCRGCGLLFIPGDITTLVPIGPGDDPDEREKARKGRAYNAVAVPVHHACATGIEV